MVVGAGAELEVVSERGVVELGSGDVLAALVVVDGVVAWREGAGEGEEGTPEEEGFRPTGQSRIRWMIPLCRREWYIEGLGANHGRDGARVRGCRRRVGGRRGGRTQ